MSSTAPHSVIRYLRTLDERHGEFAYIGLDQRLRVKLSGGSLELFGFDMIDHKRTLSSQFDVFEGLLPSGQEPVIIFHTQIVSNRFFDLHLFTEQADQWVVFLDSSKRAKSLQADQQERLNKDFIEEQRRLRNR